MRTKLTAAFAAGILSTALAVSLSVTAFAMSSEGEQEAAGAYLQERGVLQGDTSGDLMLNKELNRIELAAILTRVMGNPEHVNAEQAYYTGQCKFPDVPEWAKLYVGYCAAQSLMVGYDNGLFGAYDTVTAAAACTVTLRYMDLEPTWTYATAVSTAENAGLISGGGLHSDAVTRGEMAILLYRAMGNEYAGLAGESGGQAALSKNEDGSINPPGDGSRYVPQKGDVIRCDDGTNYTITDVSRYDKNMFASGPVGDLPEPTCNWSLLPQPELPTAEARHYTVDGRDYLFVRNLYETRRMLYTLYNAIGDNPETWQNGAPLPHPSGNPKVNINLSIPDGQTAQSFWPWKASELVALFNSCPPGTYSMECWDVYKDGIIQRTEYKVHVS